MITDEIREIGRKVLGVFWDDASARQIGLAADTFLEAVAPMILEESAKAANVVQQDDADKGLSDFADGFAAGIETAVSAIRAMGERKEPLPAPDQECI